MMPVRFTIFTLMILLIAPALAFSDTLPAGFIEEFSGPVFWKKSKDSPEVKLNDSHLSMKLFAEERLKCEPGATLKIYIYEKSEVIPCPSGWFPIPIIPPTLSRLKREALEDFGRIGGRERTEHGGVFSPSDSSTVQVNTFEIRWVPGVKMRSFALVALDDHPKELWKESVTDGASGKFTSEAAKKALREASGSTLVLKWETSTNEKGYVRFSTLAADEESAMQKALSAWAKEPNGIMRNLGRASVFVRHRMFPQAADEYEAALQKAPKSRDLMQRTADAHARTGNFERQEELLKQIQ